jgi:hypothetical protein
MADCTVHISNGQLTIECEGLNFTQTISPDQARGLVNYLSKENGGIITVDEAALLSPEDAEAVIEMAKLIDPNRRR